MQFSHPGSLAPRPFYLPRFKRGRTSASALPETAPAKTSVMVDSVAQQFRRRRVEQIVRFIIYARGQEFTQQQQPHKHYNDCLFRYTTHVVCTAHQTSYAHLRAIPPSIHLLRHRSLGVLPVNLIR